MTSITLTVHARKILPGDVLDLAGQPMRVTRSNAHLSAYCTDLWYLCLVDSWYGERYGDSGTMIGVRADALYTVQRPWNEPDAALVEVMARAICDTYTAAEKAPGWDALTAESGRDEYRAEARAALAAMREAQETA